MSEDEREEFEMLWGLLRHKWKQHAAGMSCYKCGESLRLNCWNCHEDLER